ncbi:MAG: SH3 domain-containing protein [Acidimicrobiia bacterium]
MTTFTPRVPSHRIVFLTVVGMMVAACGADGAATTSSISTTTAPTTTAALTTTTNGDATTTTTGVSVTTTAAPTTSTTTGELPGEPSDLGPEAGDRLVVMGVAHDDTLNVRGAPGANQPIVHELAPTADDLIALGHTRRLPGSFWHQIEVDGVSGWVNASFVGQPGPIDDITASVIQTMGGIPEAGTMLDLGDLIARALAVTDPPSRITLTVVPTEGDLGEVTFDIVGLEDDAVSGFRIHIFGAPGGKGFYLDTVEARNFCSRGVDPQGFCV